jgi:hypothetical protein
LKES